jgi:GAF domain-containing protein
VVRAAGSGPRERSEGGLTAVRRISDERAYLYRIIQTIGSGPDLDAILRGVIHLVTEATACHACFIYFLKDDRLELRAASRMYAHLEGRVEIPVGEGLTGWAVRSRRSTFIREGALEDPRVRRAYFPELGDEHYQSLVTVPVFARSGDAVGAITLHAEAPHEFARSDLDFLEHTASLIAGAVDNARLFEEANARVELLSDLSRLSQRIASASGTTDVLAAVTEGTRDLLAAEVCEVSLVDGHGRLTLRAATPDPPAGRSIDIASLGPPTGTTRVLSPEWSRTLARECWGDADGIPLFVPLVAGDETLGLLGVRITEPTPDAETALLAIASHAAVAVKQHQMIETLTEENVVKDLFQALSRPDPDPVTTTALAERLGCDLEAPYLVLWIIPTPGSRQGPTRRPRRATAPPDTTTWRDIAATVTGRLSSRFHGILVDHLEHSIRGLIPLGDDAVDATVRTLGELTWGDEDRPSLAVGVSNPCRGIPSFSRGFMEAESAAEVGGLIRGTPGVATYQDLGPYRYVLSTDEGMRDAYQDRLTELVDYDRRRGTELLDTLERYLDHRGSVVASSRALYIHPNTLRQRLHRIQRTSGIDVDRDDWLSLAVATKIVKLRRMRQHREASGD